MFGFKGGNKLCVFLFFPINLTEQANKIYILLYERLQFNSVYYQKDMWVHAKSLQSCPTLCKPMDCKLLCPWDSSGKNTGVGCHALLQGIFPIRGLNPRLMSLALACAFFTTNTTWEAYVYGFIFVQWTKEWIDLRNNYRYEDAHKIRE